MALLDWWLGTDVILASDMLQEAAEARRAAAAQTAKAARAVEVAAAAKAHALAATGDAREQRTRIAEQQACACAFCDT